MEGCKYGDLFDFVKNKHLSSIKAYRAEEFRKREKHYRKHCLPNNTKDSWILSVQHMFRQLCIMVKQTSYCSFGYEFGKYNGIP